MKRRHRQISMSSSPPPNMSVEKSRMKRKAKVLGALKKRDDDIMNTNDSSIVSKRCVSKLYFPDEPDFYEPLVGKYVRRNPLINRGYWLRMHAVEQVVRRFLEENNGRKKVVVNLGCGYDPLPFQFWHRHAAISENCTFVDVDYPQLIEKKKDRMMTSDLLRGALLKTNLQPQGEYLRSDKYIALGCDLRNLAFLESRLRGELDLTSSSILFLAEVSVTYMPLPYTEPLIRWANTFEDSRFCLLEQYLPQGPSHPFAKTMQAHFNKLQTPIYAVGKYPLLEQQSTRFKDAGWHAINICRSLWDLWSDDEFTPPSRRRSLDAVEPFDEWEEFALFAGHYFLLVASNMKNMNLQGPTETAATQISNTDARGKCPRSILTSYVSPKSIKFTSRRFGAAFSMSKDAVAFHGGQGPKSRLASMDVLERRAFQLNGQLCSVPQARVCHTITSIKDTEALLVGGRTSPSQALADCWVINSGEWRQVQELTPARFRHSSTKVKIPFKDSETDGVLVFGGKTSDGRVLEDWCIWRPGKGWQNVPVVGPQPSARFGAAISSMSVAELSGGLLVGGMSSDGTVVDDIWQWKIDATPDMQLTFTDRTEDIKFATGNIVHARVGAALVPFGQSLYLIGGVSKKEILSLSEEFLDISNGPGTSLHIGKANITLPESAYPLLVGFSTVAISQDELLIAGGGAVCFSMGSFWNEGFLSITGIDPQDPQPWSITVHPPELNAHVRPPKQPALVKDMGKGKDKTRRTTRDVVKPDTTIVPRLKIQSSKDFGQILGTSKPVILEGLDIGPCTKLWTLDYLKEKIGPDRELVVHECVSDRMTFKSKNFQYVKKSVGDFLDGISKGSKTYLRAVSTSQPNKLPTKLEDDFPTIAADFYLPDSLTTVRENYHSSPLRVSGPVSLWLHYDVLANVLCQVKGTKTLHLYPPRDVKYLDFPPGGSSSNVDVLTSKHTKLQCTHPHIASLAPGDVLFIPPMWAHTATPSEGMSVAVNVFFKNLDAGYAAGKDVYGNRDLQAYENGRRDIEKISKAFKNLPADISKFYLDRLVAELLEKVNKIGEN